MAKLKEREKAIALRIEKQMSYSQIKKILKVSKSTLSLWLRNYPLPEERIKELQREGQKRSAAAIERFRNTMRRKREERLKEIYETQKKIILPLSEREFFLIGLGLYWGEGAKTQPSQLSISNTDPSVIKFFIEWLKKCLSIPKEKIKLQLHLYNDMNPKKEKNFWSKTLDISSTQFTKPYIKKTSTKRINHKGGFGHGTCQARIGDTKVAEKIHMAIKVISDLYNKMRT